MSEQHTTSETSEANFAEAPERATQEQGAQPHEVFRAQAEQASVPDHSLLEGTIARVQRGLDAKVQEIRDDRRLTKEEQRAKITDLWNRVSDAYPAILKTYEQTLSEDVEKAENRLFYVGGEGQRDSVRSAYNDVYDRVKPLREAGSFEEAREELERFALRARRTGDRALKAAVGHLATELGEEGLRDAWLATSEEKTKAWNDFTEARKKLEHFQDPVGRLDMTLGRPITLIPPEEA